MSLRPALLRAAAPAKINLTLAVGPVRPDGFHPVESLIAQIALCDSITLAPSNGGIRLTCNNPAIPTNDSNLAWRAAARFAAAANLPLPDVHIHLEKRIPAGAGLGGGSSNAATILRLMESWTGVLLAPEKRVALAASLGSDVPLFLAPSPCIARGRGEQIEAVKARPGGWIVLLLPEIHCPTRDIYAEFDRGTAAAIDSSRMRAARDTLDSTSSVMPLLFNDLERPAFALFPPLKLLHERAESIAGGPVRMSGSGSSLFRLVADRVQAEALATQLRQELNVHCEVCEFFDADHPPL